MSRLGAPGFRAATVGSYATVGGQAVRTLLLARILSPSLFGVLTITNIGSNLTAYADLGTGIQGEREAARYLGLRDVREMESELVAAAGARMVSAFILFGGLCAWGLAIGPDNRLLTIQLAFLAASAPLMSLWLSCRGWLHVHGEIRHMMFCQLAQVAVWLIAVPLVAWRHGIEGALATMLLSYLPPILVAWAKAPVHAFLLPDVRAFRRLLPSGLALWFVQISNFLYVNADQALVSARLGSAAVGLYSLGTLVATALVAFSDAAALSGHVKTLEAVAATGRLSPRIPSVTTVMHTVQLGFGVIVPVAWVGAAAITMTFLTQYRDALPVVSLLGASCALIGVTVASNSALLSVGLHRRLPWLVMMAMCVKLAAMAVALRIWPTVTAAAAASMLGAIVVAVGTVHLLSLGFSDPTRSAAGLVTEFLAGSFVLLIAAALTCLAYERAGALGFLLTSLVALLVSGPLAYVHYRRRTVYAPGDPPVDATRPPAGSF